MPAGDTLFLMGCGRLFEGTPKQMWSSLSKIAALPPQTWVFCAHEYTQANTKWAQVHMEGVVSHGSALYSAKSWHQLSGSVPSCTSVH